MRSTSGGEETVLGARQSRHYLRVRIKNSGGSYVSYDSLSGVDWQEDAEIAQDANQRVAQATLRMAREANGNTLSPLINADIDAGRDTQIYGARVAAGATPDSGDYKLLFQGEIDRWDVASDPLTLIARDDSGMLVDRWVEEETDYGAEGGTVEIEDVMQSILDDWAGGAFTLYVPSSPGFAIKPYRQQKEPVLSALQTLADLIGWVVEYRWHNGTAAFRLTLYEPDRSPASPEWTFGDGAYYEMTELAVDRLDLRNVVTVSYRDAATGVRASYTATDSASVTKYGRRWMLIEEGDDSSIDSAAKATVMADAIVADLSTPIADQAIEVDLFWPAQLGDLYEYTANDVHYDVDQELATVGILHRWQRGCATTTIRARGAGAVAHTRGWTDDGLPTDETEDAISILNFHIVSRTDSSITYGWTLGAALAEAWVHDFQEPEPYSAAHWPAPDRTPEDVITDREATYTVAIPAGGDIGYLQVEGRRADGSLGRYERANIFPGDTPAGYIAFVACTVNQADGSVEIFGITTDRALSVAYAYNVGVAGVVAFPSIADAEAQGGGADGGDLIDGFTSDFLITLPAATLDFGEVIQGLLIAYENADGTGPGGATDHYLPVGFSGERFKITTEEQIEDGVVIADKLEEAAQKGHFTGMFSGITRTRVDWESGTFRLGSGTSYSISAGSLTGMSVGTIYYIYFDKNVSTTVLQTTTTQATATEAPATLVAVAKAGATSGQEAWAIKAVGGVQVDSSLVGTNAITTNKITDDAITTPKILAGAVVTASLDALAVTAVKIAANAIESAKIAAGAVTAAKISVASLSAISADLGTVTAGTVQANVIVAADTFTAPDPLFQGSITVRDGAGSTRVFIGASGGGLVNLYASGGGLAGSLYAFSTGDVSLIADDELHLGSSEDVYLKGELLSFGAADSAGSGFRQVRVPN